MRISSEEMERRYTRAQAILQGFGTNDVALNTTLIPHWIGDTNCFWYVRELKNGKEFRFVDAGKRVNEAGFDHQALAYALAQASGRAVDGEDLPITRLEWTLSPFEIAFEAFGKRWRFDPSEKSCIELSRYSDDWVISPDGALAAFTRRCNLWVRDLKNCEERQLTCDGEPHYQYAVSSSAWGVRKGNRAEVAWSPDSKRLFTLQEDSRSVKRLPIVEFAPKDGSLRPRVMGDRRVAWAGDENVHEYRFLAIEVATGRRQDAHYRRIPVFRNANGYFSERHGWWSGDSRHAYFIDIVRGGDHVARFVEFDVFTGACRVLIEEECSDTFFKLRLCSRRPIHARPLPGGDDMLWFSERSGWGHLYLYDMKTGALKRPITTGDWVVRDIHHYDPARRELVIQTSGRIKDRHPYYRDVCLVNLETGELRPIASSDDEYVVFDQETEMAANMKSSRDIHNANGVSSSGDYLVVTRSRVDTVPESLLLDREGNELLALERADVSGLPEGWQWPEPVKLKGADGDTDIYGVLYRPSHFAPDRSYPVLDYSRATKEGGYLPAGSFTNNSLAGFNYLNAAALAELGFIVVDIYGRGTMLRSRAFSSGAQHVELPNSDTLADQVAGIRQLAERYPYMDLDRVGAGGKASTGTAISGLLGYPEFYKVGVGNGASFDLRMKQAFFSEAYGDLPNKSATYTPIEDYAKNLKGKLLITHGMMAPTVNVAQAFNLIDALQRENRDFDMLMLPNDGYGMSTYVQRRTWDYLVTHLLGAEPPKNFKLTTPVDVIAARNAEEMAEATEKEETA